MKTTLKRGYGRGASVDGSGNGHGGLPPPTPVSRYRQPEPPRRSGLALVGRILLGTLLLAIMVAAGLGGGAYLYFHQSVAAVRAHTPDVKKAAKQLDIPLANHAAIAATAMNGAQMKPAFCSHICLVSAPLTHACGSPPNPRASMCPSIGAARWSAASSAPSC